MCFGVVGVPAELARTGFLCVKTPAFRSNIELDTHGGGGGGGGERYFYAHIRWLSGEIEEIVF
jgi:hypothetical protein